MRGVVRRRKLYGRREFLWGAESSSAMHGEAVIYKVFPISSSDLRLQTADPAPMTHYSYMAQRRRMGC